MSHTEASAYILELRTGRVLSLVAAAPVVQGTGDEIRLPEAARTNREHGRVPECLGHLGRVGMDVRPERFGGRFE